MKMTDTTSQLILVIDYVARRVFVMDKEVSLTKTEYELLESFRVFSPQPQPPERRLAHDAC